jgi:hypothetical protein
MMKISVLLLWLCAACAQARQYDRGYRDDERDRGDDLQLVCYGQAEKMVAESRSGYQWNPDKHKYEPTSEVTTGKRDFDSALNISIHGDRGQIRIPKDLIPPLNSGGRDGWWDLDDLMVGHNEVRGRFKLNGLNRPSLVIDRRSGTITVDGMIKFNGRCDQDSGHRRF